ncbi:glycerol-3-phosphate dehydrogenase/oxidase [Dictyobacter arantiisoli]|uniref:Glycerol-3-phosphate dehydrogenase n=1 Tax=Dictyobacter arantiisoli TaxID=2014874 RepID=A0A5A5TD51_9CHLR|nr:glycerol-3-phosphate dehydrogenase/oxidase [Dictyobacter arantiisoli]GCF09096.1 glycerol-3-phosphate dehydrogenase [Dictyobacter arantiisoli]
MHSLSAHERTQNLNTLSSDHFDVLVIGGGVTGAGVALDAASRGYSVALLEKMDFASGTSSKSTKLAHGGIRYLPNFDFALVREALVERGLLIQNAPYLVKPVAFVLPIYEGDLHPVGMPFTTPGGVGLNTLLNIGLYMYDGLAGRHNIASHHHISREEVLERAPSLIPEGLKEGFIYYDGQTNDVRLTMALIRTAARYGAIITNYTEVTGFEMENGQITGAHIHDVMGNQNLTVRAHHIINATGVFAEQVEALAGPMPEIQVEPSKGVHLVFSREDLKVGEDAVVLPETEDKRILFIVPWESRVIFGTTDTGSGDLNHPTATQEDIAYLLKYLNRYLSVHLTEDNIISTYAGYRPLVKTRQKNASTAKLSRTHAVVESPTGLITITGGKLTTYRRMAQDTLDVINRRDGVKPTHPTQNLPLQGSAAWPRVEHELQKRGVQAGLSNEIIHHLGTSYGSNAHLIYDSIEQNPGLAQQLISDLPYIRAEVIYACRYEMAMTPSDILARRTSIVLEDRARGQDVLNDVTQLMSSEFNWPSNAQQELIQTYRTNIQREVLAERH